MNPVLAQARSATRPTPAPPELFDAVELDVLHFRLHELVRQCDELPALARGIVALLARLTAAGQVWYCHQETSRIAPLAAATSTPIAPSRPMLAVIERSIAEARVIIERLPEDLGKVIFCVPIVDEGPVRQALVAIFEPDLAAFPEPRVVLMQLAAGYTSLWHSQTAARDRAWEALSAAALVELIDQVLRSSDVQGAPRALVEQLQRQFCAPLVAWIDAPRRGTCRARVLSGHCEPQRGSPLVEALESFAASACVEIAPPPGIVSPVARELCRLSGATSAFVERWQKAETDDAILIVVCEVAAPQAVARHRAFLQAAESSALRALDARQAAEPGAWKRATRWLRGVPRAKLTASFVGAAVSLIIACWPVPYRVGAGCTIEPVEQRFVVAPFEGVLKSCDARPGEIVAAGQTLAEMDDRTIAMELAALDAQRAAARKDRDRALASHQAAEAQQARFALEKLDAQCRILEHRLQNLIVTAPVGGVVLKGELTHAIGAPVQIGQTLFEVAPLAEMRLEVEIPAAEIAWIEPGQPVEAWLDAFPGRVFRGSIARVAPMADVRDGGSVFVAELRMINADGRLRPGMRGTARVRTARRPLAAHWLSRPWAMFCARFGS